MSIEVNQGWIGDALQKRHGLRSVWEEEFTANHHAFAHLLADRVTDKALKKFQEKLQDPYSHTFDKKQPFCFTLSLEIWKSQDAKKIQQLLEVELPAPFHFWVQKFSVEKNREPAYRYRRAKFIDIEHFRICMQIVHKAASEQIECILSALENKDFEFRVARLDESAISCSSQNMLSISMWPKTQMLKHIKVGPSSLISQQQNNQRWIERRRNLCFNAIVITGFVSFIIIIIVVKPLLNPNNR